MKACQVVPDIPSFAVDDGFTYLIPPDMHVEVGSRVRIKVSGRSMRGFVTAVFDAPPDRKLLEIAGVVGQIPSFDEESLDVLRWAATHYVSPMSTILQRTVPPNIPRHVRKPVEPHLPRRHSLRVVVSAARDHLGHVTRALTSNTDASVSALVVLPSVAEAEAMAEGLADIDDRTVVMATSAASASDATAAWSAAANRPPAILVGTREVALWPVARISTAIVVEDGRRVMKSPMTPTLGVREVIVARSRIEGFPVTFIGPVPTLETLALGATVESGPGRQWPLVEVLDRSEEPPSRTVILQRTASAIGSIVRRGGSVFVLVPSRGYAPAFRCIACGELRRCRQCDTTATRTNVCRRCAATLGPCAACGKERFEPLGAGIGSVRDAIARSAGDAVGVAGEGKQITVGSERDLVRHPDVSLTVAVDIDGMANAPTYRASEDAFRLLVRLAQLVEPGKGNRMLVQTADVRQPIIEALRSGRSAPFLEELMQERRAGSFPPHGELIALEIDRAVDVGDLITDAVDHDARVLGPAPMRDRDRWLIQGNDLTATRVALRRVVGTLRDKGARVRVDVDPIDL